MNALPDSFLTSRTSRIVIRRGRKAARADPELAAVVRERAAAVFAARGPARPPGPAGPAPGREEAVGPPGGGAQGDGPPGGGVPHGAAAAGSAGWEAGRPVRQAPPTQGSRRPARPPADAGEAAAGGLPGDGGAGGEVGLAVVAGAEGPPGSAGRRDAPGDAAVGGLLGDGAAGQGVGVSARPGRWGGAGSAREDAVVGGVPRKGAVDRWVRPVAGGDGRGGALDGALVDGTPAGGAAGRVVGRPVLPGWPAAGGEVGGTPAGGGTGPQVPAGVEAAGRAPAAGPVGRLRTWLYVRCGLEFKTVVALAVLLVVGAGLAVQHYVSGRPRTLRVPALAGASLAAPTTGRPPAAAARERPKVTVDVAGRVARPGLRRLPPGSRVADALAAAGGALPGTDTSTLNLARPLTDGEQILVGRTAPGAPGGAAQSASAPPGSGPPGAVLSLSSATAAQLDALPGVGPVLAQHILEFRAQHGGFASLRQLRQIPGIGDRKFATLKPLVQP